MFRRRFNCSLIFTFYFFEWKAGSNPITAVCISTKEIKTAVLISGIAFSWTLRMRLENLFSEFCSEISELQKTYKKYKPQNNHQFIIQKTTFWAKFCAWHWVGLRVWFAQWPACGLITCLLIGLICCTGLLLADWLYWLFYPFHLLIFLKFIIIFFSNSLFLFIRFPDLFIILILIFILFLKFKYY